MKAMWAPMISLDDHIERCPRCKPADDGQRDACERADQLCAEIAKHWVMEDANNMATRPVKEAKTSTWTFLKDARQLMKDPEQVLDGFPDSPLTMLQVLPVFRRWDAAHRG